MSLTITRAKGVTTLSMTSDSSGFCPALCKMCCYSRMCCSVSQHLRSVQKTFQSILGALQIMVGLLHIGLGAIVYSVEIGSLLLLARTGFPFWLGAMFILFGITCILSEKFPSPCLVSLNVILNLSGVAFAIAAITLYSLNMTSIYLMWNQLLEIDSNQGGKWTNDEALKTMMMLLQSINGLLIAMSVLEFGLVIGSLVLGIKALCSMERGENKSAQYPEYYNPLVVT